MKKQEITICGRKFKLNHLAQEDGIYQNSFKTKTQLDNWYEKVLQSKNVKSTNFGGNHYQWASFIQVEIDGELIHINPPKTKNGDANWYSYKEDFGFYVQIN